MSDLDLGGQPTKPTQTATSAPPAGGLVLEAPAAVAVVDALPLLPGGKVDRRAVAAGFLDGTIGG